MATWIVRYNEKDRKKVLDEICKITLDVSVIQHMCLVEIDDPAPLRAIPGVKDVSPNRPAFMA